MQIAVLMVYLVMGCIWQQVWQAGDMQNLAAGAAGRLAGDHAAAVSWKSWRASGTRGVRMQ